MKKTWSSLCLFVFRLEDFHLEDSHLVKHSHCITVTSLVLWLRSDYWSDIVFHWSGRWRAPSMCLWRWLRTGSGTVRVSSGSASSAGEATEKWHHCSGDEGCIRGERRLRCQGESSVCLSVCLSVYLSVCDSLSVISQLTRHGPPSGSGAVFVSGTTRLNLIASSTNIQLNSKMNWLDFGGQRSLWPHKYHIVTLSQMFGCWPVAHFRSSVGLSDVPSIGLSLFPGSLSDQLFWSEIFLDQIWLARQSSPEDFLFTIIWPLIEPKP